VGSERYSSFVQNTRSASSFPVLESSGDVFIFLGGVISVSCSRTSPGNIHCKFELSERKTDINKLLSRDANRSGRSRRAGSSDGSAEEVSV